MVGTLFIFWLLFRLPEWFGYPFAPHTKEVFLCCTSFTPKLDYIKRLKIAESNFKVFSWLNINI